MEPRALSLEIHTMQRLAINALGVIPKRSFYRTWAYQLIGEELPAARYPRLKSKLLEYADKNNLLTGRRP